MRRHQGHAHELVEQNHERLGVFASEAVLQIFRVPYEAEVGALNAALIDRRGDKHIDFTLTQILRGALQSEESGMACLGIGLAKLYEHFFIEAGKQVEASLLCFFGRRNDLERRREVHRLAVIRSHLSRAVDNRRTKFEHGRIAKHFINKFVAHAIGIAVGHGNAHLRQLLLLRRVV